MPITKQIKGFLAVSWLLIFLALLDFGVHSLVHASDLIILDGDTEKSKGISYRLVGARHT